ncbi:MULTISPECIES: hypothetical protein [Acidovorax]|uniref:DUF4148 domain-containing protein n=1 Tax=Acidovorax facilis TaxID=12917 RepID=A0ABV8DH27_9BURK|nr:MULTISPECIES: hypothetical protein [Acidovorax]MBO1011488.1 hypothetical protein [Acidovorax sp. SD340]MCO4245463.1 hypothetical protein [Acidovorax facilis]
MKIRTAILVASLAAFATASFATSVYHASPSQEEGVSLAPDHLGNAVSRQAVESTVLAAQKDGSLYWISRGYPATYPLVPGPKLTKTRQQVLDELQAAKRNPVTSDGMRDLGGEAGWVNASQMP